MGALERCTCRSGRDHDGSEFGPCEYCERQSDLANLALADLRELKADAARWRFTQRPGFRLVRGYEFSEVETNVYAVRLNGEDVGAGHDEESAVDSALRLVARHGEKVPLSEFLRECRDAAAQIGAAVRARRAARLSEMLAEAKADTPARSSEGEGAQ